MRRVFVGPSVAFMLAAMQAAPQLQRVSKAPEKDTHAQPPATFESRQQRRAAERAAQKALERATHRQELAKKKHLRAETKRQEMLRN